MSNALPPTDAPRSEEAGAGEPPVAALAATEPTGTRRAWMSGVALALGAVALVVAGLAWQRVGAIQEQVARQQTESTAASTEARALARQTSELVRESVARQSVLEARINELAQQRGQLEELMQGLSRSRDETLLVEVDAALRLAQQQAQLASSADPLLTALRAADQRLARSAQTRLAPVRSAIARDIERIRAARLTDLPGFLSRIDDLNRMVDEIPLSNALRGAVAADPARASSQPVFAGGWQGLMAKVGHEFASLVRVGRIDRPEAALVTPDQAFFLRENLRLKLLNARLGALGRQTEAARAELSAAAGLAQRYFDAGSRRTQAFQQGLQQAQSQLAGFDVPRPEEALSALARSALPR